MSLSQQRYWLKEVLKKPALMKWYFHWITSQNGKRTPLGDGLPWMTYEAIDWLSSHLTKDMSLFEWGSGGSTLFFSRHVKQVITIEHDSAWHQQVLAAIQKNGYGNILLSLVEPIRSEKIDFWHMATDISFQDFSFERYIKTIDTYPDDFFDIIVVDGRARSGCMKHAIAKIKPGGYLVLDNSERIQYERGRNLVGQWRKTLMWGSGPYNNSPWETCMWQKET